MSQVKEVRALPGGFVWQCLEVAVAPDAGPFSSPCCAAPIEFSKEHVSVAQERAVLAKCPHCSEEFLFGMMPQVFCLARLADRKIHQGLA